MRKNHYGDEDFAEQVAHYRRRLRCNVARVDDIFVDCLRAAARVMTERGLEQWLDGASDLCGMGRGQELPVIWLQEMPAVAEGIGEEILPETLVVVHMLSRTGLARAIAPFLTMLPSVARRLRSAELTRHYYTLLGMLAARVPEGLLAMLPQMETLLASLSIGGVKRWAEYGLAAYRGREHEIDGYFALQSADARAALMRERSGTLFSDHERRLGLWLRALWGREAQFNPYSSSFDLLRRPSPRMDKRGLHLPDVFEDHAGNDGQPVAGIDIYRCMLAHMAAHLHWTRPIIADNYNRFQHVFIEVFEDSRIEWLAMERYPGLRPLFLALHPIPRADACPPGHSCIRHRAAMLSRALLDPGHGYTDPVLRDFEARFRERMAANPLDTTMAGELGVACLTRWHEVDFRAPRVWFEDTEIPWRDDNSYLWVFVEDSEEPDDFTSDHAAANPKALEGMSQLPPMARLHPEWDHARESYRPDWVTVYETLPPPGNAADIDAILERHAVAARRLRALVEQLRPQDHVRVRFQEDGAELDLDIAVRALVDYRSGGTPDTRIHFSHRHDRRDVALMLLIDLSQSVSEVPNGLDSTVLDLSREATTLLAWACEALGDPLGIAGFSSNTRHEVRYQHIKGFGEAWNDEVKARLAGMEAGLSTRMGAAIRHAGHYLAARPNDKRLLLVLTDGEPSDIDVADPHYLAADTRRAIEDLSGRGVATHAISLDPASDAWVTDIFGHNRYTIIDRIGRLPEELTRIFMNLTR